MKPGLSGGLSLPACAALAALAGAGTFANSIGNDFAYDDRLIVLENESIQQLETLPGTFLEPYWPNRHGREMGLWRPVATWLYGLQWALWGGNPTGFHVVNVVLNSLCAALVVLLLGQLLPTPAAVVGGILFAVHPVHSEVVANVVGMAELLSAGLYLGACLVVVRSGKRMGPVALMVVGAFFLLACLVKESAVTLPGTVLLLDAARKTIRLGDVKAYLRERWPLYAVLALVMTGLCLGRIAVLGSIANAFPPMGAEILADGEVPRIWTVLATWPEVLRLLLFPLDLSIDYTPAVVPVAYGWTARSALGLFIGLAVLVVAWGTWRAGRLSTVVLSPRALGFGILWFVVTVLPVSNLFFLTGVLLAERTLFLPSVGLAAGAGWMLVQLRRERPRIGTAVTIAAILLFSCRTIVRNQVWKDSSTVFEALIRDHPESGRAQWLIGDFHFNRGDHAEGLLAYRRAIGMLGESYTLLSEVGRRLVFAGFDEPGERVLRRAWSKNPEFGLAPSILAVLYDRQGRWTLAEDASRAALAAEPGNLIQAHLLTRARTARQSR